MLVFLRLVYTVFVFWNDLRMTIGYRVCKLVWCWQWFWMLRFLNLGLFVWGIVLKWFLLILFVFGYDWAYLLLYSRRVSFLEWSVGIVWGNPNFDQWKRKYAWESFWVVRDRIESVVKDGWCLFGVFLKTLVKKGFGFRCIRLCLVKSACGFLDGGGMGRWWYKVFWYLKK